jgi:hypothetical protein
MKTLIHILTVTAVVSLSGCATTYHSNSYTGGFSETQLAPDTFRVMFSGNSYTSGERAQDFALLRAAELTLQGGFSHFAIVDENNSTTAQTFTTPGQAYTTGSAFGNGNMATYSSFTTYTPGQTYTFYKPQTGLLIKCFQTVPDGVSTFDAAFLQHSIRQKYGMK